ncbi:MAG: protein-disulfide reductase DsbD [Gammaproteobacteria bacterium]
MDSRADNRLTHMRRHWRWLPAVGVVALGLATAAAWGETARPERYAAVADASPLEALGKLFGDADGPEILPPDEAFKFSLSAQDASRLIASWRITDGYYLYRDKMRFTLRDSDGVSMGKIRLPRSEVKVDQFFGRVQIYTQDLLQITLPLRRESAAAQTVAMNVQYQGCAEAGVCYPPITRQVSLQLPVDGATGSSMEADDAADARRAAVASAVAPQRSEHNRVADRLAAGGVWLNIAAFFGAGLLLAFTPCVLPMIPILSGIITGQGKKTNTRAAFALSLTFVLAMAATYAIAGVAVGLSGENVQAWFQNPWVISLFAGVFVALALSMFGFYRLQMPAIVQSRLATSSRSQRSGTLVGAGIMGSLSALIVGPCVTAPLIGALLYIAHTGDAVLGGMALFALALGMGAPLLVIGTSAGRLIPKAGPWMRVINPIFGVLMLGVAVFLLERILLAAVTMSLWALLLIVAAIYMGAFDAIRPGASGWYRLWKGLGLAMSIYGALILVGAAGGGNNVFQPLEGMLGAGGERLQFQQVEGPHELRAAVARAQAAGRPVMLDFYADWCVACKEMERYTFTDTAVQTALRDTVLLQADVTANDARDRALLKSLGLFGPPAILFFTEDGRERRHWRVMGYMPATQFSRHAEQALHGAPAS